MAKTELNVKRLTETLFSNLRARLQQATGPQHNNKSHGNEVQVKHNKT